MRQYKMCVKDIGALAFTTLIHYWKEDGGLSEGLNIVFPIETLDNRHNRRRRFQDGVMDSQPRSELGFEERMANRMEQSE